MIYSAHFVNILKSETFNLFNLTNEFTSFIWTALNLGNYPFLLVLPLGVIYCGEDIFRSFITTTVRDVSSTQVPNLLDTALILVPLRALEHNLSSMTECLLKLVEKSRRSMHIQSGGVY